MAQRSTSPRKISKEATELSARLRQFYLSSDKTLKQIAYLVGGVSDYTIRRCLAGRQLRPRTAYKIQRFLNGVTANAA